jgi:hypothetical protein
MVISIFDLWREDRGEFLSPPRLLTIYDRFSARMTTWGIKRGGGRGRPSFCTKPQAFFGLMACAYAAIESSVPFY